MSNLHQIFEYIHGFSFFLIIDFQKGPWNVKGIYKLNLMNQMISYQLQSTSNWTRQCHAFISTSFQPIIYGAALFPDLLSTYNIYLSFSLFKMHISTIVHALITPFSFRTYILLEEIRFVSRSKMWGFNSHMMNKESQELQMIRFSIHIQIIKYLHDCLYSFDL